MMTWLMPMDKEAYEAQKPFAGEKIASMLRRCVGHDYTNRQIYMLTMVTEGSKPLFGHAAGRSSAEPGSPDEPHIVLSALGQRVADEWWATTSHHPEIEVLALQMMPDHLHGILFVREKMEQPLGIALRGFKQSCNRHYRELILGMPPVAPSASPPVSPSVSPVPSVALPTQQTPPQTPQQTPRRSRRGEDRTHGMLFARGYNDRLLLRSGQLSTWLSYLADNPRRLLMKREHPDLFRVKRGVQFARQTFSALGNIFLLQRPVRIQVQCSRRLTDEEIEAKTRQCLEAASAGAVLVSPSISKGEKHIMRAAFERGFPLIYLQENGFTDLAKPSGARMEACARGQLLILAPWEHHNERITISRNQCLSLNEMARIICEYNTEIE